MKNKRRHPDYLKLKKRIGEARGSIKLELLREVVLKFNSENKNDGPELLACFIEKEQELSIELKNEREFEKRNSTYLDLEEDSTESLYHTNSNYEGSEVDLFIHRNTIRTHLK